MTRRPCTTLSTLAATVTALAVTGCGASSAPSTTSAAPSARPTVAATTQSPAASATPEPNGSAVSPATGGADYYFGRMTEQQRVGQLLMNGGTATGVSSTTLDQIASYHVGSVFLSGRSSAGVTATASISRGIQDRATSHATLQVPEFVATDQEGGYVQVLKGSGFSTIPTGLTQGTYSTATLQADARTWGGQLRSAGVNLNLAPVLGTVPSAAFAPHNPPIGYYDREYGYDPAQVASHGQAFVRGMAASRVDTAVKHFPGLGRVTANTDTASTVVDSQTTRHDSYVGAFDSGLRSPAQVVMVSSATYSKIDVSQAAVFSPTVITGMLRGDAHFGGVVMTDDINGKAISSIPAAERAVRFVDAGGDLILSVSPTTIPTMYDALLSKARTDASFKAKVDAAARRVLLAKQRLGLLKGSARGDVGGTGRGTVSVYRPSNSHYYVTGHSSLHWGVAGDVPVPADYAGKGYAQWAVFRQSRGQWWLPAARGHPVSLGRSGDVPVPGDYDGTGHAQEAVYRPSTSQWIVYGHGPITWGRPGDIPVPGDFNGAGRTEIAVFRPSSGLWSIRGGSSVHLGKPGDLPVQADYHGDGRTDPAVYRPSTGDWIIVGEYRVGYGGQPGDVPVAADYDGDGQANIAIFRPSSGRWYLRQATSTTYGRSGDIPTG